MNAKAIIILATVLISAATLQSDETVKYQTTNPDQAGLLGADIVARVQDGKIQLTEEELLSLHAKVDSIPDAEQKAQVQVYMERVLTTRGELVLDSARVVVREIYDQLTALRCDPAQMPRANTTNWPPSLDEATPQGTATLFTPTFMDTCGWTRINGGLISTPVAVGDPSGTVGVYSSATFGGCTAEQMVNVRFYVGNSKILSVQGTAITSGGTETSGIGIASTEVTCSVDYNDDLYFREILNEGLTEEYWCNQIVTGILMAIGASAPLPVLGRAVIALLNGVRDVWGVIQGLSAMTEMNTTTVAGSFYAQPGWHVVNVGVRADAACFLLGQAYGRRVGGVTSIRVDGIAQPNEPLVTGSTTGQTGMSYSFTATSIDPNNDNVKYYFDWGDSTNSGWTSYQASGLPKTLSHSYSRIGDYQISVQVQDIDSMESELGYHSIAIGLPPDVTAPNTSISTGPSGTITTNNATFTWMGSDDRTATNRLMYSYQLVGYESAWSSWSSGTSRAYTALPDASYTFQVKARDLAGNIDATPAQRSFTVAVPPTLERALMCEWAGPEAFHHGPPIYEYDLGGSCYCYCDVTHVHAGDVIRWEWRYEGSTSYIDEYTVSGSPTRVSCWSQWTPDLLGNWQVAVKCNGLAIGTVPAFTVVEPQLDWPQFHHDAAHTGFASGVGAFALSEPVLKWQYQAIGIELYSRSPVVKDVDGDGLMEVVFISSRSSTNVGSVHCLDGRTGAVKWVFDCLSIQGTPALGDVDGDGAIEVVVADRQYLYCLQGSSSNVKWSRYLGSTNELMGSPVLGNIDDDPAIEVVIINATRSKIYAFSGINGDTKWSRDCSGGRPALGDVDGDGAVEVVVCTGEQVICLSGDTGEELWTHTIPFGCHSSAVVLCDVDFDNAAEVFVGNLECLDGSTGTLIWRFISNGSGCEPVIADLDGDGNFEIVASEHHTDSIRCFDGLTGSIEWTCASPWTQVFFMCATDLDTDDDIEILGSTQLGPFVLSAATGTMELAPDLPIYGLNECALADVDSDHKREIIFSSESAYIYCFDGSDDVPPVAVAGGPYVNNVGFPVTFDASASYDLDGTITGYRWDWTNDGVWDTDWLTEGITQHTYDYAYIGSARLQVKDAFDLTAEDFAEVVGNAPIYVEWDTVISSVNSGLGHAILQTPDGGYVSTGKMNLDAFLMKVDQNGDPLWTRSFSQPSWEEQGWSVDQTADQGFILAVLSYDGTVGNSDTWVIKTDSLGNEQWRRVFTEVSHNEEPFWVISCSDGGFVLAGVYDNNMWLVKLNEDSTVVWNQTYGLGQGHCVTQTADGGFLVGGGFGSSNCYCGVLRVNANGIEQWRITYPCHYFVTDIEMMPDSGYVLSTWGDQTHLMRINANGDTLWTRNLGLYAGGQILDRTFDGGFIVGGSIFVGSDWRFCLVKTDSSGIMLWREIIPDSWAGNSYYPPNLAIMEAVDHGIVVLNTNRSDEEQYLWLTKYQLDLNRAPLSLANTYPTNGTINSPIEVTLNWQGGDPDFGDSVTYDVYFGTESNPSLLATTDPYPATETEIALPLSTLQHDSTYYWKITAHDDKGHTTEGHVSVFTTEGVSPQSWQYQKTLTISNPCPNSQILLTIFKEDGHDDPEAGTIDCENHCNPDFSDLVFIGAGQADILPFWIELLGTDAGDRFAQVWIRASDQDSIYMYYGNSSATTTSDPTATFPYFDDWINDNTGNWIHGEPQANMHHWWENTKAFYSSRTLESHSKLADWNAGLWDITELGWTTDRSDCYQNVPHVSVEWNMRTGDGASNSIVRVRLNVRNDIQTTSTEFVSVPKPDNDHVLSLSLSYDSTHVAYEWQDLTAETSLASDEIIDPLAIPVPPEVPYLFHVEYDLGGGIHSWSAPTSLQWGNQPTNGGCEWLADYWFVRKFCQPEPEWISFGTEEYLGVPSVSDLTIMISGEDAILSWTYPYDATFTVYSDSLVDGEYEEIVGTTEDTTMTISDIETLSSQRFYVIRAYFDGSSAAAIKPDDRAAHTKKHVANKKSQ